MAPQNAIAVEHLPVADRRTLAAAREAFIAALARDTPGTDLPRFVKVLDAVIAWTVARGSVLAFRVREARKDVLSFELAETKVVLWSAQVTHGSGPRLEIYPPAGGALSPEERATVLETLNAHSRKALTTDDRLQIGFGALKNEAARTAVLNLMRGLLATNAQPASAPS